MIDNRRHLCNSSDEPSPAIPDGGSLVLHGFREISPTDLDDNVFRLIADDWMLLTAGPESSYNTMTASWGALGELWNRKVAFVFVRPQRHTFGYMNASGRFTMSFFTERYREALRFCGSRSGRDVDKAAETGLTPFTPAPGTTSFTEARLVMVCTRLYAQDLDPAGLADPSVEECYPDSDYHRMYVGSIDSVLSK